MKEESTKLLEMKSKSKFLSNYQALDRRLNDALSHLFKLKIMAVSNDDSSSSSSSDDDQYRSDDESNTWSNSAAPSVCSETTESAHMSRSSSLMKISAKDVKTPPKSCSNAADTSFPAFLKQLPQIYVPQLVPNLTSDKTECKPMSEVNTHPRSSSCPQHLDAPETSQILDPIIAPKQSQQSQIKLENQVEQASRSQSPTMCRDTYAVSLSKYRRCIDTSPKSSRESSIELVQRENKTSPMKGNALKIIRPFKVIPGMFKDTVFVTEVKSPSYFWIQAEDLDLEKIESKLQ